jgi:hypothetical protein
MAIRVGGAAYSPPTIRIVAANRPLMPSSRVTLTGLREQTGAGMADWTQMRLTSRALLVAGSMAALSVVVLLTVIRVMPDGAWSFDLSSWLVVADVLRHGGNPYKTTELLSWPPLWMQIVFALDHLSSPVHLRLVRLIQLTLAAVDGLTVALTYLLLRQRWHHPGAGAIVLFGLILNPAAVLLVAVHGNFDPLVGLLVLCGVWALLEWRRDAPVDAWLWACLLIGLGALAKTVPLVLAPLLLVGWQRLRIGQAMLGLTLLTGPATLGLSVILTLAPQQTYEHVIQYRSISGAFGITGLIHTWHLPVTDREYALGFAILLLVAIAGAGWVAARYLLSERALVTLAVLALMAIPVLGPGFGLQYAWWWLPLGVIAFAMNGWLVRGALIVLYVVMSASYLVDYALNVTLGAFALHFSHPSRWDHWARALETASGSTYFLLPLFGAYLLVGATLIVALKPPRRRIRAQLAPTPNLPPGSHGR